MKCTNEACPYRQEPGPIECPAANNGCGGYAPPEDVYVESGKKILDVTCGSRTIWFNKRHPAAVYCDRRREELYGVWKSTDRDSRRCCIVAPDIQCDFTDLPFPDNTFALVVFDPPHLERVGDNAWTYKKYGRLDKDWPQMLHDGFRECMRVLKPDGVLIFKWAETQIPLREILSCFSVSPLFGHTTTHNLKTHWIVFYKAVSGAWRLRPDERHKNNTPPEENEIMSDDIQARLEDKLSTATPCVRTEYATVLKTEIVQAYRRAVLGVTRRHADELCLNTEEREALNNFQ